MGLLEKKETGKMGKDKILHKMTPLKKGYRIGLTFKTAKKPQAYSLIIQLKNRVKALIDKTSKKQLKAFRKYGLITVR